MSDEAFQLATDVSSASSSASSSSQFHLDEEPIYDLLPHSLAIASAGANVRKRITSSRITRPTGSGSSIDRPRRLFVPSARYSMSLHPYSSPYSSSFPLEGEEEEEERGGGRVAFDATTHPAITESAVYGYEWKKPDIIAAEYRGGQYFYAGRKAIPAPASSSYSHHRGPFSLFSSPSSSPSSSFSSSPSPSSSSPSPSSPYSTLIPTYSLHSGHLHSSSSKYSQRPDKSEKEKSGLGPGGLLLATLPLIVAPALSYLFTPMVMPVTSAIAGGKKRKRRSPTHLKNCFRTKNHPKSSFPYLLPHLPKITENQ